MSKVAFILLVAVVLLGLISVAVLLEGQVAPALSGMLVAVVLFFVYRSMSR